MKYSVRISYYSSKSPAYAKLADDRQNIISKYKRLVDMAKAENEIIQAYIMMNISKGYNEEMNDIENKMAQLEHELDNM